MFRSSIHLLVIVLVLLAACCMQARGGAPPQKQEAGTKAQTSQTKHAQHTRPAAAHPAQRRRSNGQVLNNIAEFEIVNEGNPKASGDVDASAPTFAASIVASLFAVSGQDNVTENLRPDGDYGIWSVDAEQRFFWSPVANGKPRVTIDGTADAPKSITIRGRFGGASDSVASLGHISNRGVMPRRLPVSFAAPTTCTYTWTDPASFCHVVYKGTLTSTPSFAMDTTLGAFMEASLWQNVFPWMIYTEVKCTMDLNSKGAPYEKDCSVPSKATAKVKLLPIKVKQP